MWKLKQVKYPEIKILGFQQYVLFSTNIMIILFVPLLTKQNIE